MAAIMSTIDSQLIQASATLIKDLYLNYLRNPDHEPKKLEKQIPRLSTLATLIIGLLVVVAALNPPQMIIWLNLMAFGGLEAVFLWPLVMGLYWKRANGPGALASMLAGAISYIWMIQGKISLWGMHAIVPAITLSLVAFVGVTLLTPPPAPQVRKLFEKD